MTKTEEAKYLNTALRHSFQDALRYNGTRQGSFECSMLHLDHPVPGTEFYINPSDDGAGAMKVYENVEEIPLWQHLWAIKVAKLPPKGKIVLYALMQDWRNRPAAKIARVSHNCVIRWKTKFKVHFAQCWTAYERLFAK